MQINARPIMPLPVERILPCEKHSENSTACPTYLMSDFSRFMRDYLCVTEFLGYQTFDWMKNKIPLFYFEAELYCVLSCPDLAIWSNNWSLDDLLRRWHRL